MFHLKDYHRNSKSKYHKARDLYRDGVPEVIYGNWTHLLVLYGRDGSLKFEFLPHRAPNWTDTINVEGAAVVDLKEGKEIFVTVGYCGMVYALSAGGKFYGRSP